MRLLVCEPGAPIFREGERDDRFYVILDGRVEVLRVSSDGDPAPLVVLEPGDSLGETALVCDLPRTASAIPRNPARLLTLSRDDFMALCDRSPHLGVQVALGLSQVIAERMRLTNRLLKEAQAGPIRPEESEIERHRSGESS